MIELEIVKGQSEGIFFLFFKHYFSLLHLYKGLYMYLSMDPIYLFPDPLGDVHVAQDDDNRARNEPQREEAEERVVEPALQMCILILHYLQNCNNKSRLTTISLLKHVIPP